MQQILVSSWCFTPSQPLRLYQGEQQLLGINEISRSERLDPVVL